MHSMNGVDQCAECSAIRESLPRLTRSTICRPVHKLLTDLTEAHHPACACELCNARMLTDVQDPESYTIPGVTLAEEE
jgi:hypothetical protein